MADRVGAIMTSTPHIERLGGAPRAMPSVIGLNPMTMLTTIAFAGLDAYGAYFDQVAGDAEWQAFWADAMSDPSAELIRSGIYVNISDA